MRPAALPSLAAALLVGLLAAGCGGSEEDRADGATEDPTASASPDDSEPEATEPSGDTPVAGAGADVDPSDPQAWCGAVTADQLGALTDYEVVDVYASGDGLQTCVADLPGNELLLTWGTEPTKKSFEHYAAGFDKPAGVYEPTVVTLGEGRPAVLALRPDTPTAFAGTVVDGRVVQVSVAGVVVQDADSDELAEMARQVLAAYVA
jgi:hypothetical protein